jgi:hypothetical protein
LRHYRWIVADPHSLGGRRAVRGKRLSVSLILECLANGMTVEDVNEAFGGGFPREAMLPVLRPFDSPDASCEIRTEQARNQRLRTQAGGRPRACRQSCPVQAYMILGEFDSE